MSPPCRRGLNSAPPIRTRVLTPKTVSIAWLQVLERHLFSQSFKDQKRCIFDQLPLARRPQVRNGAYQVSWCRATQVSYGASLAKPGYLYSEQESAPLTRTDAPLQSAWKSHPSVWKGAPRIMNGTTQPVLGRCSSGH